MKLTDFLSVLDGLIGFRRVNADPEIPGIANDSRQVVPGSLFCAIKGARTNGHEFIPAALERGAGALVVSDSFNISSVPDSIPVVSVSDSYAAWGRLCGVYFGNPAESLRVHAVTGTNGKTSTAFILQSLLSHRYRCGLLSTVQCDLCDGVAREASGTMPDAWVLQQAFQTVLRNGGTDLVMEASSHGIHQHRAGKTLFSSAVFTNLTGDHLDYHGTMENYYQAKKLLFSEMMRPDAPVLINLDDAGGKRLYEELESEKIPVRLLGLSSTDNRAFCRIAGVELSGCGTTVEICMDGHLLTLRSPLIGEHNVYNLLSAFLIACAFGMDVKTLLDAAERVPPAPGRLERIALASGASAFVDYAHTDDALIRVLTSLRKIAPESRIVTVFGCGGDRDRTKRPRMGRAASELSNSVIITSDNPRSEDSRSIIDGILPGIVSGSDVVVEPDRETAILLAVSRSCPGDILLIAGKGHENYQEINGVRHPFDDRAILRRFQKPFTVPVCPAAGPPPQK